MDWLHCDQNGQFLKALGDKFSYKSSSNISDFWAILKNINFLVTAVANFWDF